MVAKCERLGQMIFTTASRLSLASTGPRGNSLCGTGLARSRLSRRSRGCNFIRQSMRPGCPRSAASALGI